MGAVVPGVTVTVTGETQSAPVAIETDHQGRFAIRLAPGSYDVRPGVTRDPDKLSGCLCPATGASPASTTPRHAAAANAWSGGSLSTSRQAPSNLRDETWDYRRVRPGPFSLISRRRHEPEDAVAMEIEVENDTGIAEPFGRPFHRRSGDNVPSFTW
jgi:hypothetical protein